MKGIKSSVTILSLLVVNFLFSFKYLSRYFDYALYIAALIGITQFAFYRFGHKIPLPAKWKSVICFVAMSLIIGLVIISHYEIPVESLNVDRWSVISTFLTELFNGNYPYFARSHMGGYPGPMPIYFLIALPFYFIGELSILSAIGYLIILEVLRRRETTRNTVFLIFFTVTSLFAIWEIATRSNLFTFSILVVFVLNRFTTLRISKTFSFYALAVLTGLLLSTRSIYILPYLIFFISSLTNKEIPFNKLFLFLSVAFISFVSTFLPFIYFFRSEFFTMNPFIVQSSFLVPTSYTIFFIFMALAMSFFVKNNSDKLFYSGASLFLAILIYASYHLINYGYEVSFVNSQVDISYFIFCVPFLMFYLLDVSAERNSETVNSKVLSRSQSQT